MPTLWLDTETYSEADLPVVGAYKYAADPTTELLMLAWAVDGGPVHLWDLSVEPALPDHLAGLLLDPGTTVVAHNSNFDRLIIEQKLGLFAPPLARWRDSMVKGLLHGLPGSLEKLGAALGLPEDQRKLAVGSRLVNRFCKPAPKNHKTRRYTRDTHPVEWAQFCDYCVQDVAAMRRLWKLIPDWNHTGTEIDLWHLDQVINDRGFYADRDLAVAGAGAADYEQIALAKQMTELTHGIVPRPTMREKLLGFINYTYNLALPDLTKATVIHTLADPTVPAGAKALLEIRQHASKTSTAKYAALRDAISIDGRFRGGIQFAGAARTRRAAGRRFQAQNLPSRGLPKHTEIEAYIRALKRGQHELLFDNLMLLGSAAIRGLVIAPPGKKLTVADLSNIEGRIVAWLAGELWKLAAFHEYDAGTGPDLYNITAVSIIGGDPWKVSKPDRNAYGKVPDLFGAYGGGVGACQTFAKAYNVLFAPHWPRLQETLPQYASAAIESWSSWGESKAQGLPMDEWLASETVKLAWRARHPATVKLWDALEKAALSAIKTPNVPFDAGPRLRVMSTVHAGRTWLLTRLPSGRFVAYYAPQVEDRGWSYMGIDTKQGSPTKGQWVRLFNYGGRMLEQATQATARDVLFDAMPAIEQAGYQIVVHVHDELVTEVPDSPEFSAATLAEMMSAGHPWTDGLPLSAAGFECYRYRKD